MGGRLVLIVGPSGAGKDTLINAARDALKGDPRFYFVRRVITRSADASAEDHDSMTPEQFAAASARGDFALTWHAHGLDYGLPVAIDDEIASGRIAVANGSRRVLAEALIRYPNARIVLINAPVEIRAARLAARGRESLADVQSRLAREADLPTGIGAIRVDNSGAIGPATTRLLDALKVLV